MYILLLYHSLLQYYIPFWQIEYLLLTHWRCCCFEVFLKIFDSFTIFVFFFFVLDVNLFWSIPFKTKAFLKWLEFLDYIFRFEIEEGQYLETFHLGKE